MRGAKFPRIQILKNFQKKILRNFDFFSKIQYNIYRKIRKDEIIFRKKSTAKFSEKILRKKGEKMSAYFEIKAKPKHIDMKGSFTITCNCRSSYIYECFHDLVPYGKEMTPLTYDIFNAARETIREDIEEAQASLGYWKKQRRLMEKSLGSAQNSEIFSEMLERLNDARESIQYCKDRIRTVENARFEIGIFEDQFRSNNADWDFWVGIEGWIPGEDPEEE